MKVIKYKIIVAILFIALISACINSNQSKITNLNAQEFILNQNEIKNILGQDWYIDPNFGGGESILLSTPKNRFSAVYRSQSIQKTGRASIYYQAFIEISIFNNTQEVKNEFQYLKQFNFAGQTELNIGDQSALRTSNNYINIWFTRDNILCRIDILNQGYYLEDLSATEKNETLSLDKVLNLAKMQDDKLLRIIQMIR